MQVLFVNYHTFTSNSAVHVFHLANTLTDRGIGCTVCVPDEKETVRLIGVPRFEILEFAEARNGALSRKEHPTLIHAWTPREIVREFTEEMALRHGCPWVVHLEDNEEIILSSNLGQDIEDLMRLPSMQLDRLVPKGLSHPRRYREFIGRACGVTALIDRLMELKPEHLPGAVFWPAFDPDLQWSGPINYPLRRTYGIADDERVIVYTGNVHSANYKEVSSLYLAVGLLNRKGIPTRLVRTGADHHALFDAPPDGLEDFVIELGFVKRCELPGLLTMADVLVQPGRADKFNDYRFPSKLPEYLATGRPVLLPKTNIGRYMKDGSECLLLEDGNALEIVEKLDGLFSSSTLGTRIGSGGRMFAETNFSWTKSAQIVERLYGQALQRLARLTVANNTESTRDAQEDIVGQVVGRITAGQRLCLKDDVLAQNALLERLRANAASYSIHGVSYATVRDYCHSMDHLRSLATVHGDLKDVQRPWILKAIVNTVPVGSRLLEIGAGHPYVAAILSRLGYKVTIVDPYDGSGCGPTEFESFSRMVPDIRFVRDVFSDRLEHPDLGHFDCIYSISVLEHVPETEIPGLFDGVRRFVDSHGGFSIHAIDHVLLGAAAEEHLAKLRAMIREMGIPEAELDTSLARLKDDPETYFLSAFGHNAWRGQTPYDDFPMRRCVSVNVCVPV